MLKKLCSYPGCHKVVDAGTKYCDRHRNTDKEKYREYKRKRMENEEEAGGSSFIIASPGKDSERARQRRSLV